jgi:hypothetical protein
MRQAPLARIVTIIVLTVSAFGCAEPVLHKSGGTTFPARGQGCPLTVVASHPGTGYVEVGQITIEGDRSFGAGTYRDPQAFADVVHDRICAAGGDTLITEVNGFGIIARGIVLRRVAPAAPPPVPAGSCEPLCSPGFRCDAGTCIPQCNPACADSETCGNDRTCHSKSAQ